ncbi:MAG: hypothetical protein J4451_01305 [DPANN group archaeon]|nr:hypothetical protein [DPANN group archaeon]
MVSDFLILIGISFVTTLIITPSVINYLKNIKLQVLDVHKIGEPSVPRSGGIAILPGIIGSLLALVFINVFVRQLNSDIIYLLAAIITLTLITFIGFFDDLRIRMDSRGEGGLKQWQKPLLSFPAAIPLMAVVAGTTILALPFIGKVNFGIFYPLILVPIGVVGAANMVNMLEGLNGLGTGMGIVYTGSLGLFAYYHNAYIAAAIAFAVFGSLIAFWHFHKTPAKILAGDSLTYLLGATIATIAILGNIEKAALIISIPFFIELALKMRGGLRHTTIGKINSSGKLESKYDKIYSLPHIWMRTGKYTETQIVNYLILLQLFFAVLIWFV